MMISLINFEGNYDKECSNLTKHLDTSRLAKAAIFLSFAHSILFVRLMNQSVTKTGSAAIFSRMNISEVVFHLRDINSTMTKAWETEFSPYANIKVNTG